MLSHLCWNIIIIIQGIDNISSNQWGFLKRCKYLLITFLPKLSCKEQNYHRIINWIQKCVNQKKKCPKKYNVEKYGINMNENYALILFYCYIQLQWVFISVFHNFCVFITSNQRVINKITKLTCYKTTFLCVF